MKKFQILKLQLILKSTIFVLVCLFKIRFTYSRRSKHMDMIVDYRYNLLL